MFAPSVEPCRPLLSRVREIPGGGTLNWSLFELLSLMKISIPPDGQLPAAGPSARVTCHL